MKLLRFFIILLFCSLLISAQEFEGYVKYKIDSENETVFIDYYKKGNNVRMEPDVAGSQGAAMLFKEDKSYVIMPEQGMYMEMDFKGMQKYMAEQEGTEKKEMEKPVKTGETKEMHGYTAEKWLFTDEDTEIEVWAAQGLGDFVMMDMRMPMGQKSTLPEWYQDIKGKGFFPMLVVARDEDGTLQGRMEVVEINTDELKDSMFEIPQGYKKLSMPMGGN